MKIVVQVKLAPTPEQASALAATLMAVNDAATWVSKIAHVNGVPREYELRRHAYGELKSRGFGAQAAQHVSWQYDASTVSIWTTAGRMRGVAFAGGASQLRTLRMYRQGESDLIFRDGMWFLAATCEVPESEQLKPSGFIGVDLGIVNIATVSTGYQATGRKLNRYRRRQLRLRAKGTKSAKRLLKKRSRKEQRHTTDINHCISKTIVTEAERTSSGISLEELKGIRQRVRLRKPQRVAIHSWAFAQLAEFIVYKARRAGVPLVFVDPAYTSRQCATCGYVDKKNRIDQALFICRSCGVVAHADRNASHNIAIRGETVWNAGRQSRVSGSP